MMGTLLVVNRYEVYHFPIWYCCIVLFDVIYPEVMVENSYFEVVSFVYLGCTQETTHNNSVRTTSSSTTTFVASSTIDDYL